jgi:hypothetical protein
MRIRAGVLVAILWFSADVAVAGRWVVNEHDTCVREWTPSSLARGPLAMTNSLTLPVRQLVGGGQAGYEDTLHSTGERIVRTPVLALLGFGTGMAECLFVMSQGLADFLTGGVFDLVPDESAELSLAPMTPRFLEPLKQRPTTDPCGRPPRGA